jgi:hypothetical protein
MERVFVSLLGNVAKHTPAPTPLRVSARATGADVEAIVEDRAGPARRREDQVFESFERGERTPGARARARARHQPRDRRGPRRLASTPSAATGAGRASW